MRYASQDIIQRLIRLRMLVLDVDGTLTDGRLYLSESGDYIRAFCIKDGLAMRTLMAQGCIVGWISHSTFAAAIERRAQMLQVPYCYVGREDKAQVLGKWCQSLKIKANEVGVIGDDVNDLSLFECCGLSACPSDANEAVKAQSDIRLETKGGYGCVAEWLYEYFLPAQTW